MVRHSRMLVVTALAFAFPAGARADKLDEVIQRIADMVAKHNSYSMKTTVNQDFQTPDMSMKSDGDSMTEFMRDGDKWMFRSDSTSAMTQTMGGQTQTTNSKTTVVADGEFIWTLTEAEGNKSAMKSRMDKSYSMQLDKAYFDRMKTDYDLALLPDEKVNGAATWVIEAKAKKPSPGAAVTMLTYFDQSHGLSVKSVGKDANGKAVFTSVSTDVKINPSISADRFVFKAPDGVQVYDMTQNQHTYPEQHGDDDHEGHDHAGHDHDHGDQQGKDDAPKAEDKPAEKEKKGVLPKFPKRKP